MPHDDGDDDDDDDFPRLVRRGRGSNFKGVLCLMMMVIE